MHSKLVNKIKIKKRKKQYQKKTKKKTQFIIRATGQDTPTFIIIHYVRRTRRMAE